MTMKKSKKSRMEEQQQNLIVSPFDDQNITGLPQGSNLNGLPSNLANMDLSSNNQLLSLFLNNS